MNSLRMSGIALRSHISDQRKEEVDTFPITPQLTVVLVGNNSASLSYIRKKEELAKYIGIGFTLLHLPEDISEEVLLKHITQLNQDSTVHGFIVQLPLPKHINTHHILESIAPEKDVDGFHPLNVGYMSTYNPKAMLPATPSAIMELLHFYNIPLEGKHAVIIGRSNLVGKPLAMLLLQANCTVTICHSKTPDIAALSSQADILICATGQPHMITASMVKEQAVCIDVGCTFVDGKACGDIDPSVFEKTSAYAPVPGGVGPGTVSMLMKNTILAYKLQHHAA